MNVIKKVMLFIKNIFVKQDEIKELTEPKVTIEENKKEKFIESLKITTIEKRKKNRVETLACNGDGLGIQKKITC